MKWRNIHGAVLQTASPLLNNDISIPSASTLCVGFCSLAIALLLSQELAVVMHVLNFNTDCSEQLSGLGLGVQPYAGDVQSVHHGRMFEAPWVWMHRCHREKGWGGSIQAWCSLKSYHCGNDQERVLLYFFRCIVMEKNTIIIIFYFLKLVLSWVSRFRKLQQIGWHFLCT